MMLDEGDGGLRGLDLRRLLDDHYVVLDMTGDHFVHGGHRCKTKRQTDDETQAYLTGNLDPTVEAVFVLLEGLDIIVRKAQRAHQQRRDEHQNHIDVRQLTEQQTRQQDGGNDDEAAHRRYAFLTYIEGVGLLIALRLGDVTALHEIDEPVAEPDAYQQRNNAGYDGAERDIGEQTRT